MPLPRFAADKSKFIINAIEKSPVRHLSWFSKLQHSVDRSRGLGIPAKSRARQPSSCKCQQLAQPKAFPKLGGGGEGAVAKADSKIDTKQTKSESLRRNHPQPRSHHPNFHPTPYHTIPSRSPLSDTSAVAAKNCATGATLECCT